MYEQLRSSIAMQLIQTQTIDLNLINSILSCIDKAVTNYEITPKVQTIAVKEDHDSLIKTYLAARLLEGLSKGSATNYARGLRKFFNDIDKPDNSITTNDIRAWLYTYQKSRNLSNRSLNGWRITLNGYFKWMYENDYIEKNPCATIPAIKFPKRKRTYLTQMELEYLRDSCNNVRDRAILEFLYSTGCRVSELCTVKLSDINWKAREVQLFGKGSKYRTGYLNDKAIFYLKKYLATRSDQYDCLFLTNRRVKTPIKKNDVEFIIGKLSDEIAEKYGVTKRVTPHILRHTTATVAIRSGMPVSEIQLMLGHANISTTMIYAEVDQSDVRDSHRKYVI